MSKKPAIEVKNLSKSYKISHLNNNAQTQTLRDEIVRLSKKPLQKIGGHHGMHREEFYALNNVSFSIMPGESVGVVGRNGSGKSTLFKILSRITQPTSGEVKIRGRVSSLLEVGSGFHAELTGRENVYFNGAILGMSKAEIDKKFDSIVEFSEIESFIDTPVKFYSSGMKSRLGFSVASHMEPDIFLVDEVLAVGDIGFKLKSIEKMKEISSEGRTVMFVGHIMSKIKKVCDTGIMLKNGEILTTGPIKDVAEAYLLENRASAQNDDEDEEGDDEMTESKNVPLHIRTDFKGGGEIKFESLTAKVGINEKMRPKLTIELKAKNTLQKPIEDLQIAVILKSKSKDTVTTLSTAMQNKKMKINADSTASLRYEVDNLTVRPGKYKIHLYAGSLSRPKKVYCSMKNGGKIEIPDFEMFDVPLIDLHDLKGPTLFDFDVDIES